MRIVSYNILDGGEGRADPLAEVIEAQRPDIVALVEADVPATVERIARRLSMDFIEAPGEKHTSALLSRWPISQSINHALLHKDLSRSFLEATVIEPGGTHWPVGVLHLPAGALESNEQARLAEIRIVLELLSPHRKEKRPHLLCGDLNANAPYQKIIPDHCKAKTREAWEKNGGQIRRQVIENLLAARYVDTFRLHHDENNDMLGSFDTQHPGQRVDYIFAFGLPNASIKNAWIEHDRLAKYASDHFPICAEIDAEGSAS